MWSYIQDYVIIFLCIGKIDAREKNEKREKQRRFGLFQIVMFGICRYNSFVWVPKLLKILGPLKFEHL